MKRNWRAQVGLWRRGFGCLGLVLVLGACNEAAAPPSPSKTPLSGGTARPTARGAEGLTELVLGAYGSPPGSAPPYAAGGGLGVIPKELPVGAIPSNLTTVANQLAKQLGVPGVGLSTGTGTAYNLNGASGFQLIVSSDGLHFNFTPAVSIREQGQAKSAAVAEKVALTYLAAHGLPGTGLGLKWIPGVTVAYGADRKVFLQWVQDGLPVVDMDGKAEGITVSVATKIRTGVLSVVAITGTLPLAILGGVSQYGGLTTAGILADLNQGSIDPNSYFLNPTGTPYSDNKAKGGSPVELSGGTLAVVDSFGFAVPVMVFTVEGRNFSKLVICAVMACGPKTGAVS